MSATRQHFLPSDNRTGGALLSGEVSMFSRTRRAFLKLLGFGGVAAVTSGTLLASVSSGPARCPQCDTGNAEIAEYCYRCGSLLTTSQATTLATTLTEVLQGKATIQWSCGDRTSSMEGYVTSISCDTSADELVSTELVMRITGVVVTECLT